MAFSASTLEDLARPGIESLGRIIINPERDYVLLDKAKKLTVEDALKYGVAPAVGAGVATIATPSEGEGATLPQSAIDWAERNYRKLNPGHVTSPEQWGNITNIFRHDVPANLGVKTPARDAADLRYLQELSKNPNLPNLNPETMNRYRAGMAALPEKVHEVPYIFKFMENADPKHGGSYSFDSKTGTSTVQLNPNSILDPAGTSAHEIGGHFVLTDPRHRGMFTEEQLLPIDDSKLLNFSLENKRKNLGLTNYSQQSFNEADPATRALMIKDQNLYRSKPGEVVSYDVGDKVVDALAKGRIGLDEFANAGEYAKYISAKAEVANQRARNEFFSKKTSPETAPHATVETQNSHLPIPADSKDMSKIDTTSLELTKQPNALEQFGKTVSRGVEPFAVVGKGLGEKAIDITKSLAKVSTGIGDGTPVNFDDVKNIAEAATLAVNPVTKTGLTALNVAFDFFNPGELNAELPDPATVKTKQEFRNTPYQQRTIPEVVQNIALGAGALGLGALAMKSKLLKNEAGAINLEGFYSPLTKALEEGRIGKSILSPKMSHEQVLKTLQSSGIKEDELLFSGVGEALAAGGKDKIGATRLEELAKMAKEGALGFSREDSPGTHSGYSLFAEGDPSFKNAVYKLPGVKFEEGHFGEGVIAHRRYGDKEISYNEPLNKEFVNSITSGFTYNGNLTLEQVQDAKRYNELIHHGDTSIPEINTEFKKLNDKYMGIKKLDSLLLDEVQSQFYEKGSKFGHGEPKISIDEGAKDEFTQLARAYNRIKEPGINQDQITRNINFIERHKESNPELYNAAARYNELGDTASKIDRSTPEGFSKGLQVDNEQDKLFKRYSGQIESPVDNAPLRGEKYVELLAKDHLRDALASGKDAISWTPSEVQHERYYGKDALGGMKWEFHPEYGVLITVPNSPVRKTITSLEDLNKSVGSAASKKILDDLSKGMGEGTLEGNAKEVYQKLYDRAIPKAFEKLTGEKPREGWVKGRNREDVKIQWIPLDKVKERMVTPAPSKLTGSKEFRLLDDKLISNPLVEQEITDLPSVDKAVDMLNRSKKLNEEAIRYQYRDGYSQEFNDNQKKKYMKRLDEVNQDINTIKQFKDQYLPKIKDLPIAQADQTAKDFFNV